MDVEKRVEALEAMLRGPTGEEREESEMRSRVYDSFRRHKTEGAPVPDLTPEEQEHWDDLEVYYGIALRVAAMTAGGVA